MRPALVLGTSPNMEKEKFFTKICENLKTGEKLPYDMVYRTRITWLRQLEETIFQVIEKGLWNTILPVSSPEFKTRFELASDLLLPHGVEVEAVDKGYMRPVFEENLATLDSLDLPKFSYSEVLEGLQEEMTEEIAK